VVSLKSVLLLNFGAALAFSLLGMLSVYSGTLLPADKYRNVPMFDAAERAAMDQAEPSRERAQAMYYFDSARELSRARSGDTERYLADVRLLCFTAAILFALGGIGVLLLGRGGKNLAE